MSSAAPPSGTTRYLCPLECGWHYDRAPIPGTVWINPNATFESAAEAIQHMAGEAVRQDFEHVEQALREHLGTHTTEQFVRTIQGLRAEVAALRERPVGGEEKNA
jgi:hypothetical protein